MSGKNLSRRRKPGIVAFEIAMILVAVAFIYPAVYVLINTVKPTQEIQLDPVGFPDKPTLENFVKVWMTEGAGGVRFADALLNTAVLMPPEVPLALPEWNQPAGLSAPLGPLQDPAQTVLAQTEYPFTEQVFPVPGPQNAGGAPGSGPMLIVPPGADTPMRPLVLNLRNEAVADGFERVLEVVPADASAREPLRLAPGAGLSTLSVAGLGTL